MKFWNLIYNKFELSLTGFVGGARIKYLMHKWLRDLKGGLDEEKTGTTVEGKNERGRSEGSHSSLGAQMSVNRGCELGAEAPVLTVGTPSPKVQLGLLGLPSTPRRASAVPHPEVEQICTQQHKRDRHTGKERKRRERGREGNG